MTNKLSNLQDIFINTARKEKIEITVYLINGVPIKGRVLSFDNFTLLIEVDKKQNLIYKHAISTISPVKPISYAENSEEKKD